MPTVKTTSKIVRDGSSIKKGSIIEATYEEVEMNPDLFEVVRDDENPEPETAAPDAQ